MAALLAGHQEWMRRWYGGDDFCSREVSWSVALCYKGLGGAEALCLENSGLSPGGLHYHLPLPIMTRRRLCPCMQMLADDAEAGAEDEKEVEELKKQGINPLPKPPPGDRKSTRLNSSHQR